MRRTSLRRRRWSDGPSRRDVIAAAAALAVLTMARPGAAEDAAGFIKQVGDDVVAILSRPGLDDEARLDQLVALLNRATDLELVSRLVLGQYWRTANDTQRKEYTGLFRALVIKAMADRLNQYGGETFEVTGSRAVDARDTLVSTRIHLPDQGAPINVDWRVRALDDRLAIIDLVAEGVSMVVTQRSEVTAVVGQRGIDGLIEEMRQRLERQA
jgi:phospholipid transport system substrate-binding protein